KIGSIRSSPDPKPVCPPPCSKYALISISPIDDCCYPQHTRALHRGSMWTQVFTADEYRPGLPAPDDLVPEEFAEGSAPESILDQTPGNSGQLRRACARMRS